MIPRRAPLLCCIVTLAVAFAGLGAQELPPAPTVGPPAGTLVAAGGGVMDAQVLQSFIRYAGGPGARIVVIPTAGDADEYPDDWKGLELFEDAGVASVTVLHTRDPLEADSPEFVRPLQEATGVWIPGGQQWRLVDAYLGTRTHRELEALLARGGVVGGTSAGASILASFLVRGSKQDRGRVVAEGGYDKGFGFLKAVAVDQHLLTRSRQTDLFQVLGRRPDLLGIGLDEGAAIVVQGDVARVIGSSRVAIYGARDRGDESYYFLSPGDVFDLASRTRVQSTADQPSTGR